MKKEEFISELKRLLKRSPSAELSERLDFYGEMIDDRIEEGLTEEDAVASVGSPKEIALQISSELLARKKKKCSAEKRKLKPWEICVLILGSPLWIAFFAVGLAVLIAVFAVVLSLNITLWALEITFFLFSLLSHYLLIACKHTGKISIAFARWSVGLIARFFGAKKI